MAYVPPTVSIDRDGAFHRRANCPSLLLRGLAGLAALPDARHRHAACVGCVVNRPDDHQVGGGVWGISAGPMGTRR
jgi:hypothetical protein